MNISPVHAGASSLAMAQEASNCASVRPLAAASQNTGGNREPASTMSHAPRGPFIPNTASARAANTEGSPRSLS
ncbi:hypothetical protein D8L93_06130 [Sodalis-like symbiont of Bactericera trigonica]|nr:hypothetical protein D8L93_06130 [Sodalis-like symbiont of Bactericera trigonica]